MGADILLRDILRRALRKAGLPELRFHDLRHMAGDDSADKIAALAGMSQSVDLGNKVETNDSVESKEVGVSDCFIGSPGRIRTADQRINSPSLYH
jgi:hypothetical protein